MNINQLFNTITGKKSVNALQKSSADALSIFSETVNKLTQINEEINLQIGEREVIISQLEIECDDLSTQATSNAKVIGKIKDILK
jgi:hypothetical protein